MAERAERMLGPPGYGSLTARINLNNAFFDILHKNETKGEPDAAEMRRPSGGLRVVNIFAPLR